VRLNDEELELFELAFSLGVPISTVISEMSYEEILGWFDYFKRRPLGWREDNRTAMIMMASGATIKPAEIFPSLAALRDNEKSAEGFPTKNSAMFAKMMSAVGGVKLEL
jgi:hypothetical protein